jgi:hypothetical protein
LRPGRSLRRTVGDERAEGLPRLEKGRHFRLMLWCGALRCRSARGGKSGRRARRRKKTRIFLFLTSLEFSGN